MITERKEDLAQVEVDSFIVKLLEKYYKAFLGDRIGEVENGNVYDQGRGQPAQVSGEVGSLDQLDIRR